MSKDHETPMPSVIELAMDRLAREADVQAKAKSEPVVAGRREYDKALSRRFRSCLTSVEPNPTVSVPCC